MSFLTPPPEFDECVDTCGLLSNEACNIRDIFYPSPSISSAGHIRSEVYSPNSPSRRNDGSFMDQEPNQHPVFASQHASLQFDHSVSNTQAANMYSLEGSFAMYEPTTWSPYPPITAQYPHLPSGHEVPSSFYEGFPPAEPSLSGMLPPTPQSVTPNGYSFAVPIRTNEAANFFNSIQPRQTFTPEASISASMSNPSRSCSPNPSIIGSTRDRQRRSRTLSATVASTPSPLSHYGIPVRSPGSLTNSAPQAWRCAYPNCSSRATFIRGCDLRKHYNRHSKHLFCRVAGCPQSEAAAMVTAQAQDPTCPDPSQLMLSGGFSSKKDRARHEAKHNPGIKCEWHGPDGEECGRLFSRMDNMKDHVRRIHHKGQTSPSAGSTSSTDRNRRLKRNGR